MKSIIKNILKSICYILLFLGMQVIVIFGAQFVYGFIAGYESAMTGVELDAVVLAENMQTFILDNTNWISVVYGSLTILFLWLFFVIRKKKFSYEVGIRSLEGKKIIPAIILGIALSFFVSSVLSILPIPEEIWESYAESSQSIIEGSLLSRILGIVIMAPLVEEIIFRGLILSRLKRAMKVPVAMVISSLFFGVMHGHPLWIAYATLMGIVLALVAEKTESVGITILIHMAFNSVTVWAPDFEPTGFMAYLVAIVTLAIAVGCCILIFKKSTVEFEEETYVGCKEA